MRRPSKPEVVVLTGASAGVGRATARAYAPIYPTKGSDVPFML
jgi:NADP-dependent 3-hydroxy acid dehydrogenase YdfG